MTNDRLGEIEIDVDDLLTFMFDKVVSKPVAPTEIDVDDFLTFIADQVASKLGAHFKLLDEAEERLRVSVMREMCGAVRRVAVMGRIMGNHRKWSEP